MHEGKKFRNLTFNKAHLKCIPGDYLIKLVERMPRVCKAVIKAKGDLFNTFWVTTWFHMCYFIVLMSSLLFYNVEKSTNKDKPWNDVSTLCQLWTGTVYTVTKI